MKRALVSIATAAACMAALAAPAGAAPAPKPSLAITSICVAGDALEVRVDWANQSPGPGSLNMAYDFNGPRLPRSSASQAFLAPDGGMGADGFAVATLPPLIGRDGPVAWESWSSVTATARGAFRDSTRAVRQPAEGWTSCQPEL